MAAGKSWTSISGAERTWRPFVQLHYKYLLPGNLETQYALFLYKHGRLEEALAKADKAILLIKNKPAIFRSYHSKGTFKTLSGALRTRTLILAGMGRYDEARDTAAEFQKLVGPDVKNVALALLEYYCGRLDEALAQAQAVPPEDAYFDSMRAVMTNVYCMKGEFQEAIQALSYEPAKASKFYSRSGLEVLNKAPEGPPLIALQEKKAAQVFPPGRMVMLARLCRDGTFQKSSRCAQRRSEIARPGTWVAKSLLQVPSLQPGRPGEQ